MTKDEPTSTPVVTDAIAQQVKIEAGVNAYITDLGIPSTPDKAVAERDFWVREACRFSRNEDYYRGLLDECAAAIGPEAWKADDGSVVDDEPVRARIPELVLAALAAIKGTSMPKDEPTPAPVVTDTTEAVARAICCARHRCEGCLGNGEGGCFDPELWMVEAASAIQAAQPVLTDAMRGFVQSVAEQRLNDPPGDAMNRRDMIIRARAAMQAAKPVVDSEKTWRDAQAGD